MKKLMTYIAACSMALSMNSCLDLEPTSEITDANYWKSADQFDAFNTGLKAQFRSYGYIFEEWGELRSDIYGGTPFSGEAPSAERIWNNTIDAANPGISDYGGVYTAINQINLMIDKANESSVLTEAQKGKYLGAAYGMRAYMYFHLLRSYGDVVLHTVHTEGSTLDLNNLSKAQSPAVDVMAQIKEDIENSEKAYNNNYSFTDGRTSWSLTATKVLKGDVYLWSGKQMGGGTADYQTAKQAFMDVDNADVALQTDYANVFSFDNKENSEIIFAIYNGENETALWGGSYSGNYVLNSAVISAYQMYDYSSEDFVALNRSSYRNNDGRNFVSVNKDMFDGDEALSRVYNEGDKRYQATYVEVYGKDAVNPPYMGLLCNKYHGTMLSGGSKTSWYDDQPIYRYADAILGLAEAKVLLGEDPTEEINKIRERAYGKTNFDANRSTLAYPNDHMDNQFVGSDTDPVEAVLKERLREFAFEGKRWYDIRLMDKATKYSSAKANRLLWPIDENALGENSKLHQTPGYEIQ